MLTPRFNCVQDDTSVVISIYVPSIRASEVEIHVDGSLVSVHVNPYFLRLNFSSRVVEDDESNANYDPSIGYLTVKLSKESKGEHFHDLDLLAKLLAPRIQSPRANRRGPLIEDIDTRNQLHSEDDLMIAESFDWQFPQQVPDDESIVLKPSRPYGFLDLHSGFFQHVLHTENEVNELAADAENISMKDREHRRQSHEDEKWDEEYYIADFVNDEEIREYVAWSNPMAAAASSKRECTFSEQEKLTMMKLPRREYLHDSSHSRLLYLNLVSLLFALSYDTRTTLADPTPESAWTVSSLIPCFSALDITPAATSLSATLIASYRRALAFPLYRNWALCEKCREDVVCLLRGGKRWVFKMLLQMKQLLDAHDIYYVYSKIWVDDYCAWIQAYASDQTLSSLGSELNDLVLPKSVLGWDIQILEDAIREVEPDSDDEEENAVERMHPEIL